MTKLLFADDEPDIRETVQQLLGASFPDVHVSLASHGLEALKMLESGRYDVLVTDYRMPGLDGAALLEVVRKRWPKLTCVMLTAYIDPTSLSELDHRLPGLEIIPKPLDLDVFLPRLREILQGATKT